MINTSNAQATSQATIVDEPIYNPRTSMPVSSHDKKLCHMLQQHNTCADSMFKPDCCIQMVRAFLEIGQNTTSIGLYDSCEGHILFMADPKREL